MEAGRMRTTILLVLLGLISMPVFGLASEPSAAQKSVICGARTTCAIGKSYDAGKSPGGDALTVVEVRLGLKDKPEDAPDSGCQNGDKYDGGVEYWLVAGDAAPKQILKLCNDGYGAAGVGEDDITVGSNQFVHRQMGGSSDRWDSTVTFSLVPFRALTERDCNYSNLSPNNGVLTDIDYRTLTVRSIAKDTSAKWDDVGCPTWPPDASEHFAPQPAPNLLGAYNLVTPILGTDVPPAKIPTGTVIDDCVPAMTTAGANGFIVFGAAAPADQAAEIRVVAESMSSLTIQVYDPAAAGQTSAASWVNLPHIEIWTGLGTEGNRTRLQFNQLAQIAVDLSGKVYPGVGKKEAAPTVERWKGRDAAGHPVTVIRLTWAKDMEFLYGGAVVYSQAVAGKQTRLVATTGIVKNHPLYVPDITSLPNGMVEPKPGVCSIRDGRLVMGK